MRLTSRFGAAGLAIYFWAFVIFLFAPLAVLLIFSVNKSPVPTLPLSGFSTRWFHDAFSNGTLTGALLRSIAIALVAAVLATALGIMASLGLLVLRGRAAALALTVLLLPLVVPYICLAVGLLILVQQVGAQPSLVAVVLGHCVIVLPFAILVIMPRLRSLDPAMNEAAQDLGASPLAALRLITLPLLAPALVRECAHARVAARSHCGRGADHRRIAGAHSARRGRPEVGRAQARRRDGIRSGGTA
jgi:spermidine/putrescine transport system permease protein